MSTIDQAIQKAVELRTREIIEEEADKAAKNVRERVVKLHADVAATVIKQMDFRTMGNTITISFNVP